MSKLFILDKNTHVFYNRYSLEILDYVYIPITQLTKIEIIVNRRVMCGLTDGSTVCRNS